MKKKRMICLLLALCMVLTMLPGRATASDTDTRADETEEPCQLYTAEEPAGQEAGEPEPLDEVIATGDEWRYRVVGEYARLERYLGTETSITIPTKICKVDENGAVLATYPVDPYGGLTNVPKNVESVTIPNYYQRIPQAMMSNCRELKEVSLPNSVTEIGYCAFKDCTSLTEVELPDSLITMKGSVFDHCENLKSVTIPEGVTALGNREFYGCTSLESVTVPGSVYDLSNGLFYGCTSLEDVTIEEGVVFGSAYAFSGCTGLKSVTLPVSMTRFGDYMFEGCTSLTDVTLSEKARYIDSYMFLGCTSLEHITLPKKAIVIEEGAFAYCTALTDVTIQLGLRTISKAAFAYCTSLTDIVLPQTVHGIGEGAFLGCVELANASVNCRIESLEPYTFAYCVSLEKIELPIELRTIGEGAFGECVSLTEITVPDTVETVGDLAFYDCTGLKTVRYSGTEKNRGKIRYGQENDHLKKAKWICGVPYTLTQFKDISTGKFYAWPVRWAVESGITSGKTATRFAPESSCTRAQVMTFLWRYMGSPAPESQENPFEDVPEGMFYTDAVLWAVENGITTGVDATHFAPDAAVSRAQFVTFLYRAKGSPAIRDPYRFKDVQRGQYYEDAVMWAYGNHVTGGTSDGYFSPNGKCTRGQVVTFLYRDASEDRW